MSDSTTTNVAGVPVSTAHFIDGKRVASARTFEDRSPIDRSHLADVSAGGPTEIDAAVASARRAFPSWAALGPEGRLPATKIGPLIHPDAFFHVNCFFVRDLAAPFGGARNSGIGREGGTWSMDFYCDVKNVSMLKDSFTLTNA
jgi:acyl-CoA reductase-like NAD-dependent aldehyde dehydrogenase